MHASAPALEPEPPAIQDGMPRYLLPCLETSITTVSGASATVWHNRGLNSMPLGSTWMLWGEAPFALLGRQPSSADRGAVRGNDVCTTNVLFGYVLTSHLRIR